MDYYPKISVILSVYNDEKNIEAAVKSILDQTYKNLELLVIDDSSNDKTYDIVKKIEDKRLKVFKNKTNLGLTKSLNILIKLSEGTLIARQDSDDISSKYRFEKQVAFLNKYNLDACTTRAKVKGTDNSIPKFSYIFPNKYVIKFKNPFIHGTLIIRKKVLENIGLYDENYTYAQDYKLFTDLFEKKYKIKTLNEKLYILNMEGNISSLKKIEQKKAFKQIRKKSY